MIIPEYWAEGRVQHRKKGRQVTVRRFGWSNASHDEAQAMADARAREALDRVLAGERLARREPKRPYNGAEGVPIREEVVSRHGEAVVTRNAYGARCLNTPNVLFVDIDNQEKPSFGFMLLAIILVVVPSAAAGWWVHSRLAGLVLGCLGVMLSGPIATRVHAAWRRSKGGPEGLARDRIGRWLRGRDGWGLRLYRTPAGLRVLVTHQTFEPDDPAVAECFKALGADPIYARMCRNQRCFRARVSPKPWRIGMTQHLKPRPGVWPVDPERMPARIQWIERYERAARDFAACSFVETIGSGTIHPDVRAVQQLHDDLCRATRSMPIA